MIRPGGLELSDRALVLAGLLPGSTVFDIGCGSGETVFYLRKKGYEARGIDLRLPQEPKASVPSAEFFCGGCGSTVPVQPLQLSGKAVPAQPVQLSGKAVPAQSVQLSGKAVPVQPLQLSDTAALEERAAAPKLSEFLEQADAARMPYGSASADGLLFECSFTKMKDPEQVLAEAFRVLKQNGRLVIADLYARREEAVFDGWIGRLETEDHLKKRLTEAGFVLLREEKYDRLIQAFSGNLILERGPEEAERLLGGPLSVLKRCSPGYLLMVFIPAIAAESDPSACYPEQR